MVIDDETQVPPEPPILFVERITKEYPEDYQRLRQ